ncbi:MAG: hypothetical protein OXU64_10445 [Gemmatimonadota bacterium]|nr:hypothetical protein [Gemmatimonadota bacterium]
MPSSLARVSRTIVSACVILAGLCTACSNDMEPNRTVAPAARSFSDMFHLVRVVTPQQSLESPIVRISGATWDGNNFAIADVSEGNAKLFDGDGRLVAIVGRHGDGPGEFRSPRFPELHADRLYVADGDLRRVSVWTRDGALDREIPLDAGFVSDFAILSDGRIALAGEGFGKAGETLAVFDGRGTTLATGLSIGNVLPEDADRSGGPWNNVRQTFLAVSNDTAWAVSTISDSVWMMPLDGETVTATSYRLDIPGYVAPQAPQTQLRSVRELSDWAGSFHSAAPPVGSSQLLAIPYVRGVLNYGDPTILVLRDDRGFWHALSTAPPIIAAHERSLLAIHNPLGDFVQLAIYETRQ